jgi:glutathione synthase/RimK-type ligase-like ATP-grasp enzyme
MKKVLILFGRSNWKNKKIFRDDIARESYESMYSLFEAHDIRVYRASYEWYDFKKHVFSHAWTFGKKAGWVRSRQVRPDVVYDKTPSSPEVYAKKTEIAKKYPIINNLLFTELIDNKLTISLLFKKWAKRAWLVSNTKSLREALKKIKTEMIVLKPLSESGGKDVIIFKKKSTLPITKIGQDYIVQEFIDSSRGIPKITNGTHDLRVVLVNEKIIYSHIRKPKTGCLLANVALGGTISLVPVGKIPKSILLIVSEVNNLFSAFHPRIYSIDFMFDSSGRPWIIELNSMPGLFIYPGKELMMKKMYKELIKIFRDF